MSKRTKNIKRISVYWMRRHSKCVEGIIDFGDPCRTCSRIAWGYFLSKKERLAKLRIDMARTASESEDFWASQNYFSGVRVIAPPAFACVVAIP